VALPAYQDYTVRAKVSELMLAASGVRTAISEKFQTDPSNTACAGGGVTIPVVGKVSAASVTDAGTITVYGDTTSTSVGQSVTVTVTPAYSTLTGTITWSCIGSPSKYMPATCR
jgi:type IV pilus assembly protein PilA